MTKQHPLTDEICLQIIDDGNQSNEDDMRDAADWQLEQVINWINNNLATGCYLSPTGYSGHEIDVDDLLNDLTKAMRPQQLEDN